MSFSGGCKWFQANDGEETERKRKREGRSCCDNCHSDLHRESHMVVSCRIALLGTLKPRMTDRCVFLCLPFIQALFVRRFSFSDFPVSSTGHCNVAYVV